jgi:uncharacterized membrane protein
MKPQFPHDRVVFFSDAVFAIAITLLVIEIKIPTPEQVEAYGMLGVLNHLIPLLIAFFISFLVTALFWRWHLIIMNFVKHVDNKLIWLNIWLLMFVALLPFSSGFYSEYFDSNATFVIYCADLACIGLTSYQLTRYIIKKENLAEVVGIAQAQWMKLRALIVPVVFLVCIPLTFISPIAGRTGFVLIFILQFAGSRYYRNRV